LFLRFDKNSKNKNSFFVFFLYFLVYFDKNACLAAHVVFWHEWLL